ncbi:molybdate ABC transporter substrate-binding protein [Methyloceanibacter methanicus]|uniref:Molybdate ABC transporter substrate-binding protein n=1 Tax=Methyloceanibacter methanicus TaxID=1774968 RepID=A0A1E3VWM9_9HYPH|nr:molybdate ABC transporter substrate-binding protein [Methyloceanibacter methanicus]ODR97943.1 molybdate ABC transporter substrate-binding protein [Methyloceanibacter methanicus]
MAHAILRFCVGLAMASLACLSAEPVRAGEATVAVAANFTLAAKRIGAAFEAETGHRVVFSFGSTGQLFTQIAHEAPFDAFLAADTARPERAETEGLGVPGTRFTYAIGVLVLWSADSDLIDGSPSVLSDPKLAHVAIANPVTAPYGAAAIETMTKLGVLQDVKPRLVEGKSVGQTYQFVATGNAPVGFVALSQVSEDPSGSRWVVPGDMHDPLRQDAILLAHGRDNAAAKAFLEFLRSAKALKIIEGLGYVVPDKD